mmetsp:Transcript_91909/g.182581  ORF Transcript_91909/g.182581 Transcript_91909/m.182581 type:complete len:757 (+) Transcript_91909:78-2348(+)
MGQSLVCQTPPQDCTSGLERESVGNLPACGPACVLQRCNLPRTCGCGHLQQPTQEYVVDPKCSPLEASFSGDPLAESEASTSDPDDSPDSVGHLVLARHRVFSPHLHSKFHDHYRIERLIGEGSYGNVYEAVARTIVGILEDDAQPTERRVAVKCFMIGQKDVQPGEDWEMSMREIATRRFSFERERSIMARAEHPHLVKMYECFEDRDYLWIVMELCRGGEIYERVAEKVRNGAPAGLDEHLGRDYFRQMLSALSYLHGISVVHRDVKTENFLLLGEPGCHHDHVIKLCDFGTAVQLTAQQPRAMERIGTLSYTAPEVYARLGACVLADSWSLGVVLYVLLVGASPFRETGDEPREDTVRRIQAGEYDQTRPAWLSLSPGAQDLVRRLLVVEERGRLRSVQALRHTWMLGGRQQQSAISNQPSMLGSKGVHPAKDGALVYATYASVLLHFFKRFACLDALQQLVLILCAQLTSEADLQELQSPVPWYDLFMALDVNEDGRLDFPEFVQGLRHFLNLSTTSVSDAQLEALVRALDLDCSGSVDWVEWVAVSLLSVEGLRQGSDLQGLCSRPEPLRTAFRLLDRPSGDGTIGAVDLMAVINSGATGASLSTVDGREAALRIIGGWSRPDSNTKVGRLCTPGSRGGHHRPPLQTLAPSLTLVDLQRALKAALLQGKDLSGGDEVCGLSSPCCVTQPGACCGAWCQEAPNSMGQMQVFVDQQPITQWAPKGSADSTSGKSEAEQDGIACGECSPAAHVV